MLISLDHLVQVRDTCGHQGWDTAAADSQIRTSLENGSDDLDEE